MHVGVDLLEAVSGHGFGALQPSVHAEPGRLQHGGHQDVEIGRAVAYAALDAHSWTRTPRHPVPAQRCSTPQLAQ